MDKSKTKNTTNSKDTGSEYINSLNNFKQLRNLQSNGEEGKPSHGTTTDCTAKSITNIITLTGTVK